MKRNENGVLRVLGVGWYAVTVIGNCFESAGRETMQIHISDLKDVSLPGRRINELYVCWSYEVLKVIWSQKWASQ